MGWEEDKRAYIDKLRRVDTGVEKIFRLEGNQIVTPVMEEALRDLREQAQELLHKLETDEFEIAVVGLESSGKSYFANALTGLRALPTDDARCTYTATCVRPAAENEATVVFYNETEFTRDLQEKLQELGIPDSSRYSLDNLSLDRYLQLYDNCSDDVKSKYSGTLHQDIVDTLENAASLGELIGRPPLRFPEADLDSPGFKKYITDPAHAIAVKDVTIYSTELGRMLGASTGSGLNAVLYDVPGFNSPTAMHREQTLQKMRRADVIVMVALANEPSLVSAVLDIFDRPDSDGRLMKDKLFVFANKADWATDLEKNKEITRKEWITRRRIISPEHADRIVFGSAKAYLGDGDARSLLEKKGVSDGIQEIRSKLVDYYTTDRFKELRQRIDKILFDVDELFSGAKNKFGASPLAGGPDREAYNILFSERRRAIESQIHSGLVTLRSRLNREVSENHPLTESLEEAIERATSPERFAIDDALIQQMDFENAGVGMAQQPDRVNHDIRQRRFEEMYDAFTSGVLSGTRSRHRDVSADITEIFMSAMDADPQSAEALRGEVAAFCGLEERPEDSSDGYYQSLIERFARDLFEVQIQRAPGPDRLLKFQEEAANFFSLGVFFDAASSGEDAHGYAMRAPSESPMWRLLMYPDFASVLEDDSVERKLLELTGLTELDTDSRRLLRRLVGVAGPRVFDILEKSFKGVVLGKSQASTIVARVLEDVLENEAPDPMRIFDGEQYLSDMLDWQKDYTYKKVQEEFSDDIRALRMVLKNAFVPAVHLDKAFSARETKLIEDILAKLKSASFDRFFSHNFNLIAAPALRDFEREEAQRQLNVAVMQEIQQILDQIKSPA